MPRQSWISVIAAMPRQRWLSSVEICSTVGHFPKEQCVCLIDPVSLRALCAYFENYVAAVALGREGLTTQSGRNMCESSSAAE